MYIILSIQKFYLENFFINYLKKGFLDFTYVFCAFTQITFILHKFDTIIHNI